MDDLSGPKEMIMTFKIREAGRSKAEKCDLEAEVMQGCKPENEQGIGSWKRQGQWFTLRSSRRNMALILDPFWIPYLQNYKIIVCIVLSH